MKRLLQVVVGLVGVVVLLVGVGLGLLFLVFPRGGPVSDVKVERTDARLERGRYLAQNVAACVQCHSTRDWSMYTGPVQDGTLGQGGEAFDERSGFPGAIYAANITPVGVGDWSDGEFIRAFTAGVSKDGHALFPVMPYPLYRTMATEDVDSIVCYLRTLPPIQNAVPKRHLDFPLNLIVRTIPQPPDPQPLPATSDQVAYGAYLTHMAGCEECHTPTKHGRIVESLAFSGGRDFKFPNGTVIRSPNLTPDPSGLGAMDSAGFVSLFKSFDISKDRHRLLSAFRALRLRRSTAPQTVMPWTSYAGMTPEDLQAIYAYLRTVKPLASSGQ